MLDDLDPEFLECINDYEIRLIDPHQIESFSGFHTELGDVLEFIKRQKEDDYLKKLRVEKGDDWEMSLESVNAINTFTGAKIPTDNVKEGKVLMCRATEAIREDGLKEGIELRDTQKISEMLNDGKTPEAIVEFCKYPMEQVMKVYNEIHGGEGENS